MKKILFYNFIVFFSFNFIHPITPQLLLNKGTPDFLNAILLSALSLGMFITSPKVGELNQKYGPKFFIVTGPFLYGLMQIGFGLFNSTILMLLVRFVAGIFTACFVVSMMIYINAKAPKSKKTKYFSLLIVMTSLGGVFGQIFSGAMVSYFDSINVAFILQFTVTFVIGVVMYFTIDNPKIEGGRSKALSVKQTFGLIKTNNLAVLYIVMILVITSSVVYASNIGYYTAQLLDFSVMQVSFVNSYTSLMILIANLFIAKRVEAHFGLRKSIFLQVVIGLIAVGAAIIFIKTAFAFVFFGIFVMSLAFIRPLVNKKISLLDTPDTAVLLGTANAVNSFSMMIGGVIASMSYSIYPNLPFYMIMLLLFAALVMMVVKKNEI